MNTTSTTIIAPQSAPSDLFSYSPDNSSLVRSAAVASAPKTTNPVPAGIYNGQLSKVRLMNLDTQDVFVLPFNPEELNVVIPTDFGQYTGVQHVPQLFYSGIKVDRMIVKFIATDRVDGILKYFTPLIALAKPVASKTLPYGAPSKVHMTYGKLGSFIGYVSQPELQPTIMGLNLTPILGYITFTFNVQRYIPGNGYTVTTSFGPLPK